MSGSETSLLSFFAELRRRRVIRVAIVYAIVGWIVIEVASTMLPGLKLPSWTVTFVIALVVLGFPIAVIMGWMFDLGPHGVQRTEPVPATPEIPAQQTEPRVKTHPAQQHNDEPGHAAPRPRASEHDGRRSIAVLPFVNMSGDADNEYFSDGVAEEILNLLTKLPQFKVSSRTSSFVFKGKEVNIRTVANELGVSTVLEGSVRRAGEHVRITAELIETDTDSHLWSETYDREMKDVFAIQDDIARSIVDALKMTLSPKERRAIQYVATSNAQAYDFYLRGRKYFYNLNQRDSLRAIEMYERAIELDPKYAAAWAGLANAYAIRNRFLETNAKNVKKALESSERAVQLDPDSAEAHVSRGHALFIDNQFEQAERHFETAMMLNPNLFEAYFLYGTSCSSQGNFEKAAWLYIRAFEIDPAEYLSLTYLAQAYCAMGRKQDELDTRRQALKIIEQRLQVDPDDYRALQMGFSHLAVLGERDKAIERTNLTLRLLPDEPKVRYNAACMFAQLGDTSRALDLLEEAVKMGWGDLAWIQNDSDLASLHGNPRFRDVLSRID